MADIVLEQALYGSQGAGGYRFLARSPGFLPEWLPLAEQLCTGFGERPAGVTCPECVFTRPFGPRHVAVVQVADQGTDDTGRPGALGFRLLVLPRPDYVALGGDPFAIAERYLPPWNARGDLPPLTWSGGPPPRRTVADLQRVLQRTGDESLLPDEHVPRGGSQVLLGGCQALVDGARLVFERPAPDTDLLRNLWMLLPTNSRCELWPASFAFGNALHFDALVVPRITGADFDGYKTEQQAADYPEGNYELNLQTAAEAGDQNALDALFARRTHAETLRLVLIILAVLIVLVVVIRFLPIPAFQGPTAPATTPGSAHSARLDLPPPEQYPTLSAQERQRLAQALADLAQQRHLATPPAAAPEELLAALDRDLGTPDPQHNPGPLRDLGPPERQLRALLWKHDVAGYRDPALNPVELVERLQQKVAGRQVTAR